MIIDDAELPIGGPSDRRLDPTTRGDLHADLMRRWYEANRETWLDRHNVFHVPDRSGVHADEFMLRLIGAVCETDKQLPK